MYLGAWVSPVTAEAQTDVQHGEVKRYISGMLSARYGVSESARAKLSVGDGPIMEQRRRDVGLEPVPRRRVVYGFEISLPLHGAQTICQFMWLITESGCSLKPALVKIDIERFTGRFLAGTTQKSNHASGYRLVEVFLNAAECHDQPVFDDSSSPYAVATVVRE